MTKTTYILTNGTEVATLKEAKQSGMGYTTNYIPVPQPEPPMTEKRKAMRAKVSLKKQWKGVDKFNPE